jgi:hypothetical protein
MDEKKWDEAEALLAKLEKRVNDLEFKRGNDNRSGNNSATQPDAKKIAVTDESLVEENKQLKGKVEKLEYRILMLTRALKEADSKANLDPHMLI